MVADCVLKIGEPLLKPGTEVLIGPLDNRFRGTIYRSHITLYCDQSVFIEYAVEWWDERQLHRETFHSSDVEVCDEQ